MAENEIDFDSERAQLSTFITFNSFAGLESNHSQSSNIVCYLISVSISPNDSIQNAWNDQIGHTSAAKTQMAHPNTVLSPRGKQV